MPQLMLEVTPLLTSNSAIGDSEVSILVAGKLDPRLQARVR